MDAKGEEVKKRIVSHMNKDHQDSLVRYLEHYKNISSFTAKDAQLVDMSLDSLKIKASGKTHVVAIEPPMNSMSEARERVIEMDKTATKALGRSDITVKEYRLPRTAGECVIASWVAIAWTVFTIRSTTQPGSPVYELAYNASPGFANFLSQSQPYVLSFMLLAHGIEAVYMVRSTLRKHNVPLGSRIWWQWTLSTFGEGFGAFIRFNQIVTEKTKAREKAAH